MHNEGQKQSVTCNVPGFDWCDSQRVNATTITNVQLPFTHHNLSVDCTPFVCSFFSFLCVFICLSQWRAGNLCLQFSSLCVSVRGVVLVKELGRVFSYLAQFNALPVLMRLSCLRTLCVVLNRYTGKN